MVAPYPSRPSDTQVLDAIIIGGGPAGLSAALVLVRRDKRLLTKWSCDCDSLYDEAGNVIQAHEHRGDFKEW